MSATFYKIDYDVDKYLADGGQLLDITMMPTAIEQAALQRQVPNFERSKRIQRVGNFLKLVGEVVGADEKVGSKLTEKQLRELWDRSATTVENAIAKDAERYRLAQAQKLLELFEDAHGRPATTVTELLEWVASPEGRAAIAYDLDEDGKIIP